MKRLNNFCAVFVFLLLAVSVTSCADLYDGFEVKTVVYVSETGSASGDGTENSPFNSLQLAINKINQSTDTSATWTILVDGTIGGKTTISGLQAAKLFIKKNNNSSEAKITGNNNPDTGPLLKVSGPADIEIENITFHGGRSEEHGGGIKIENDNANVTLNSSTVTACTANSYGGGIYVSHGILTLNNCTITSNYASSGGGIYNGSGTVYVSGMTFSSNIPNNTYGNITDQ